MFEPTGAGAPQYTGENTANTFSKCRLLSPMAQKASAEGSATNENVDRLDIVWAVENGSAGVLHAYDPADLAHEYYNSAQARFQAQPGQGHSNLAAFDRQRERGLVVCVDRANSGLVRGPGGLRAGFALGLSQTASHVAAKRIEITL